MPMRTQRLQNFLEDVTKYFDLESELDNLDKIHDNIVKDIAIKGTNLWILMFAIIVASVGLNMNSTAVIIGAMLISPLMGPINGMGYSIATYDFALLRLSVKNFSFAVVASLIASTTYFALSPISTAHSELLARTSPSIYDVLIALFGGTAGIVAITSKHKGNVIPGVAIATALMPPLCTAGYGLATGKFDFFFGALYLFTINTVFIALSALLVSQILKFPIRTIVEPEQKRNVNRWIWSIILIVLLPSIYFGYQLVQQEKFKENANRFVSNVSIFEENYLLDSEVDASEKHILLVYGGTTFTEEQKAAIRLKARDFQLKGTKVKISQGLAFKESDEKNFEIANLRGEIDNYYNKLKRKESEIDSIQNRRKFGEVLLKEIQPLFPEVLACSYSESFMFTDLSGADELTYLVYFKMQGPIDDQEIKRQKLKQWLQRRLKHDEVLVIIDEIAE